MIILAIILATALSSAALLAASACACRDEVLPEGAGVVMFGAAAMLSMLSGLCWAFVGFQLAGAW